MQNRRNALWLVLIALILTGLFTGRSILFNLAYLFSGLLILSMLWSWVTVRGVRIGRKTRTRRSQVGHKFTETFTVRNAFFLPKLWLEFRDESNLPGHRASHVVPSLWPGRSYQWRVETLCQVRGEFKLGPMTILSGDPFGFYLTPRRIDASESIIVYPRIIPINTFKLPSGLLSGGDITRHMTQQITTNAAGVREYVPGDSINRVHWKSTARRNQLIVKEFELDPMVDIWLLTDFSQQSLYEAPGVQRLEENGMVIPSGDTLPASTEEYAVAIAASLAAHFIDIERALGFVACTPDREIYQPERGQRQLTRILESLAVARSTGNQSLSNLLTLETPGMTRGATVLTITSSLETDWISELQLLLRRGLRPVCIFIDPTSFGQTGSSDEVISGLQMARIPHLVIHQGDNLRSVLQQRAF
jgi:uncharacterized protein (DUF58 family)